MPKVYLIDDSAPNAFATGRDPKHASVAVTTGLLDKLDREELQGVIGHELSHVRNYDIRFSLLVGVLVGSIALLADMFVRFTFWCGRRAPVARQDSGGGGPRPCIMVVALVLAILAPFFATLVQMAVSRQREFLADASSVELTRNPSGLERALATISADTGAAGGRQPGDPAPVHRQPHQEARRRAPAGLFSTHPPIRERIDRLRALTGQPPLDAGSRPEPRAGLD